MQRGGGTSGSKRPGRRKKFKDRRDIKRKSPEPDFHEPVTVVPKKRKIGRSRSKPKAYDDFLSDVELGLYNRKWFSPKRDKKVLCRIIRRGYKTKFWVGGLKYYNKLLWLRATKDFRICQVTHGNWPNVSRDSQKVRLIDKNRAKHTFGTIFIFISLSALLMKDLT